MEEGSNRSQSFVGSTLLTSAKFSKKALKPNLEGRAQTFDYLKAEVVSE